MSKKAKLTMRVMSLLLCLICALSSLVACGDGTLTDDELNFQTLCENGSYVTLYLTDDVVDFDPARAFNNDSSLAICNLIYEPLFYMNSKGKVESRLVSDWDFEKSNRNGEAVLTLYLNQIKWSNGSGYITAEDVEFAWKRILKSSADNQAAALLYDIKNAREAKAGEVSIDDVGIYALEDYTLQIFFTNNDIDLDRFFLNLTSVALTPLSQNGVNTSDDWAKKSSTCYCSGPFKIAKVAIANIENDVLDAYDNYTKANSNYEVAKKALESAKAANDTIAQNEAESDMAVCEAEKEAALATLDEYFNESYLENESTYSGCIKTLNSEISKWENAQKTWTDDEKNLKKASTSTAVKLNSDIAKQKNIITTQVTKIAAAREALNQYLKNPIITYTDTYYDEDYEREITKEFPASTISYILLERNANYYPGDDVDDTVLPYRLIVQCGLTDEEVQTNYANGTLFYINDIPLSLRETYKDEATVTDAMSTFAYYFNENALISNSAGEDQAIFAIKEVRQALSLALDRNAIAEAVVFADAATGLVPNKVFDNISSKKTFRSVGGDILNTSADIAAAKSLLASAGITPSNFSFTISVAAYDDVNIKIAEMAKEAWSQLGFNVTLKEYGLITNNDYYLATKSYPSDAVDDLFMENYRSGEYEVIGLDIVAMTADPYSMLAPFAYEFSGTSMNMEAENAEDYSLCPHSTGYNSEAYNELMETIFAYTSDSERADALHQAEEILLDDMPVAPVIFNKNASLTSKKLTGLKSTAYGTPGADFTRAKLKNWENYIEDFSALLE